MKMDERSTSPFLIVGLGNPGREYRDSRHNIGFMVVDNLTKKFDVAFSRHQADALVTDWKSGDKKIIFAKPQTYMNLSGRSVSTILRYYRIDFARCLIIYDDLDLPLGSVRIRSEGGSGGHKGMKSIIDVLATSDVPRMRLGIGRPAGSTDPADFVLDAFSADEVEIVNITLSRATDCAITFIREGIDAAMNRCNPTHEA
jgi:PTH1 family peptidyl-tRNA hydrolase